MKKILVIRNDKIGDFMLAWPSFAMLKLSMPNAHITALVPAYTAPLAELSPWIDDIIIDCGKHADKATKKALVSTLKEAHFDAVISLYSTMYNSLLVWKVGIKYRLTTGAKIAQFFYNHRLIQHRSRSLKPEYAYNLDIMRYFLKQQKRDIIEPTAPYLSFSSADIAAQKEKLAKQLNINPNKPWLFLHATTGGSAPPIAADKYAKLFLALEYDYELIITAAPGEEEKVMPIKRQLADKRQAVIYADNDGLIDFTRSLACAQLLIAGSTGPLHIAAALDVPTVGFFQSYRSSSALRWQPMNSQGKHLAISISATGNKEQDKDLSRLDMKAAIQEINPWVAQFLSESTNQHT